MNHPLDYMMEVSPDYEPVNLRDAALELLNALNAGDWNRINEARAALRDLVEKETK